MAIAKIVLFTSKKLNNGAHPVMLRVTHKGIRKYYSLDFACAKNEWIKEPGLFESSYKNSKTRNRFLSETLFKADDIIDKIKFSHREFSFEEFNRFYIGIESKGVYPFYDEIIQRQKDIGKIGNSNAYRDSKNSLLKFHKSKNLQFNDIDYAFLKKYEEHLRARGVLNNTIGAYMRNLRALFNSAIKEKHCRSDIYPFKEYSVNKLKNEPSRKALTKDEIKLIANCKTNPISKQELSKNIFLFSYYNRGMNYNDIAKLKWKNISHGRIEYVRSKTGKRFSIKVSSSIQNILDFCKSIPSEGVYVFPILNESHQTPQQIKNRIKSGLKHMNSHLKIIAQQVGLDKKLTSYIARHSYAVILKNQGVPIAVISDGMGHESERVTKIYLESFGNDVLDKADELLM